MKKTAILTLMLGLFSLGFAQPKITKVSFPNSVKIFDLYEISFQLGSYNNPYDPEIIDVYAEFVSPEGNLFKVNGFYFEGYSFQQINGHEQAQVERGSFGWRIRFTPNQTGSWRFTIHAKDKHGETTLSTYESKACAFNCLAVDSCTGFIRKANSIFLKRETVANGRKGHHSYFPVGPNVAWYGNKTYYEYDKPRGIFEYNMYIDSLSGNANYMRIWLNRYQYLSLYGPEFTQTVNGKPVLHFDSSINQKDAAELDHIISYAARNDISLMLSIFTYGDFAIHHNQAELHHPQPSDWRNNPFHTQLGLTSPCEFFSDKEAKRITRNLLRYIVARWGYATNVACWELWNEVTNMSHDCPNNLYQSDLIVWHTEMADYLRSIDPFDHLISTSLGGTAGLGQLNKNIFKPLDFVQFHNYQNIHKAKSKDEFSHILFKKSNEARKMYPTKPFFMGEFAFDQSQPNLLYEDHDPKGIDLHNSLWSSLFSGSMGPASFWYWEMLYRSDLLRIFRPMLNFCKQLPLLSDSFTAHTTGEVVRHSLVFPNNLETYYMVNKTEDTILGWSQDTAFCYKSLRRLCGTVGKNGIFDETKVTDPKGYVYTLNPEKRPKPSSKSNTITLPISKQRVGTQYIVKWFDAETGLEITSERTTAKVKRECVLNKVLSIEFPSSVRDLKNGKINNTLGDAVFILTVDDGKQKGSSTQGATSRKTMKINPKRP